MQNKEYKVLDLFAGAGGFSLGFKKFKNENGDKPFRVIGAVEKDTCAAETLISSLSKMQNISEEEARSIVICEDITLEETKAKLYKKCEKPLDVLIGGPPCQSFSTIGPRSGDKEKQQKFDKDDRDNLFEHYIEILKHYGPKFFVFENVKGILSKKNHEGNKYIDIIINRLEGSGYHLVTNPDKPKQKYLLLNAANFGVPQLRERVFIIGKKSDENLEDPYPETTHCHPDQLKDKPGLLPYVTLKDAINDLPPLEAKLTYFATEKGKRVSDERKKEIDEINKTRDNGKDEMPFHKNLFSIFYDAGSGARKRFMNFIRPENSNTVLTGHIARGQQESDIRLFQGMTPGMSSDILFAPESPPELKELSKLIKYKMDSFTDKYKRLSWDRPCNTIFAHMTKDGNRFIHPGQTRTLTVREAARVQSFPDDYIFKAIGNRRYQYIGNAVPPMLAMAIAKAIYKVLKSNDS